jgi:flagellar biosynthesis GTPase FlhF
MSDLETIDHQDAAREINLGFHRSVAAVEEKKENKAQYAINWKWAFWLVTIFGTLTFPVFLWSGLYHLASDQRMDYHRGRGYLRGAILGSLAHLLFLFAVGLILLSIGVLTLSHAQAKAESEYKIINARLEKEEAQRRGAEITQRQIRELELKAAAATAEAAREERLRIERDERLAEGKRLDALREAAAEREREAERRRLDDEELARERAILEGKMQRERDAAAAERKEQEREAERLRQAALAQFKADEEARAAKKAALDRELELMLAHRFVLKNGREIVAVKHEKRGDFYEVEDDKGKKHWIDGQDIKEIVRPVPKP